MCAFKKSPSIFDKSWEKIMNWRAFPEPDIGYLQKLRANIKLQNKTSRHILLKVWDRFRILQPSGGRQEK